MFSETVVAHLSHNAVTLSDREYSPIIEVLEIGNNMIERIRRWIPIGAYDISVAKIA